MTAVQMGLTIAVCTAATMLTRFLPFLIFSSKEQQPPEVVRYLGRVLPAACAAGDHRTAQVEAPDPAQRSRGHPLLCTSGAAGVLSSDAQW